MIFSKCRFVQLVRDLTKWRVTVYGSRAIKQGITRASLKSTWITMEVSGLSESTHLASSENQD